MPVNGEAKREANQRYRRKRAVMHLLAPDQKTVHIRLEVPSSLAAWIQRVYDEAVAKGTHHWRNRTQVYIELLRKGFLDLDDPLVDEAKPYLEAKAQLDARRSQRMEAQSLFAQAQEEIEALLAEGEHENAAIHYHTSLDAAKKMSPTVWRDWFLRKLPQTYPELAAISTKGMAVGKR